MAGYRDRRRSLLLALLAALLGLGAASPAAVHADIYQCAGADGSVHFTNVASQGRRCRVIIRDERPLPGRSPPASATNRIPPDRYSLYDSHIREAARLYQIPEAFLRAVMQVESAFIPDAVSVDGAVGLMQLMPRTAASMGVRNPWDPRENILGGARYLRVLANRFNGDLVLTIAAYNAGEGAVERYGGVPPYDETRRYVQRVLRYYYSFRGQATGA